MSEKELAEIEARAEAATSGPWYSEDQGKVSQKGTPYHFVGVVAIVTDPATPSAKRDQNFIAHARQDVPALCEEVRRLNGELAMAMDAVDELSRQMVEIERLTAENALAQTEAERRRNELTVMLNERLLPMEQENKRLRAALEPFAKMAEEISELERQALEAGYSKYFLIVGKDGKALEFSDFRRALEALKGGAQ